MGFLLFNKEGLTWVSSIYICTWSHRLSLVYLRGGPVGQGVEVRVERPKERSVTSPSLFLGLELGLQGWEQRPQGNEASTSICITLTPTT
jgi:hypothetical protein